MLPPARLSHCPICRASRGEERDSCRRCGADLSWPLRILREAHRESQLARQALLREDLIQARHHARQACLLHRTPFNELLEAFVSGVR
ncbi:MAG: hypothetical protein HQL56_15295 [Magnetococcales bacterium]|nr:hypothetical protein [Magnetococcales bacterium]